MDTQHNKALARRFFEGLHRADRAALLALVQPDLTWVVPKSAVEPYAGTHDGAEHIVALMLDAVARAFEPGSAHHELLLCLAEGDTVVAETRMTARRPDGAEYDNHYVFIFECRDGRIGQIREHVDTAYAIRFFGAA